MSPLLQIILRFFIFWSNYLILMRRKQIVVLLLIVSIVLALIFFASKKVARESPQDTSASSTNQTRYFQSRQSSFVSPAHQTEETPCVMLKRKLLALDMTDFGVIEQDDSSWKLMLYVDRPAELRSAMGQLVQESKCRPDASVDPDLVELVSDCQKKDGFCFPLLMKVRRRSDFELNKDIPTSELKDVSSMLDRMAFFAESGGDAQDILEAAENVLKLWPENEMAHESRIGALYRLYEANSRPRDELRVELEAAIQDAKSYESLDDKVRETRAALAKDDPEALAALGREVLESETDPYFKSYGYYYLAQSVPDRDSEQRRKLILSYLEECIKMAGDSVPCKHSQDKLTGVTKDDSSLFSNLAGSIGWTEPVRWKPED